jgi:hypothetical protein
MNRLLASLLLLFSGVACSPAPAPPDDTKPDDTKPDDRKPDDKKSPSLTPEEIADGTILLFDGETTLGWKIDGDAKVEDGVLKIGGKKAATASTRMRQSSGKIQAEASWTGAKGPVLCHSGFITLTLTDSTKDGKFFDQKWSNGFFSSSREMDGTRVESYGGNDPALGPNVDADSELWLRNVKLRFEGQKIKTWAPLADGKAKLEEGDDGWQVLKGGEGGVASADEFTHYVLQMECKLAGDKPKAAVQVRASVDKPEGGVAVLLQPGKDGKLALGEVDGKQKPRKELAARGETFYLTVMAAENDVGVWVNGVQVTDWSGEAAEKDKKFERGPVLLRLLDPSTELSIRNVRYVKLIEDRIPPKKKPEK